MKIKFPFGKPRANPDAAEAEVLLDKAEPTLAAVDEAAVGLADSVEQPTVEGEVAAPAVVEASGGQKKGFFAKRAKATAKSGGASVGEIEKRKYEPLPIRVLIGYLPEVREKDARDYAMGTAEKHFEQPAIAYYDAFKYGEGFAYEVHEGGGGHAYLPEIIKYFNEQGEFEPGEDVRVVIRTGTRKVEVKRTKSGLAAILLPESGQQEPTAWLKGSSKMSPALNQRTGLLVTGAVFFITGFLSMIVGSLMTRFQPYEAPINPAVARISYEALPIGQWRLLQGLPPNAYVSKLTFENGKWDRAIRMDAQPSAGAPAVAPPGPVAPGGAPNGVVPPASAPIAPAVVPPAHTQ